MMEVRDLPMWVEGEKPEGKRVAEACLQYQSQYLKSLHVGGNGVGKNRDLQIPLQRKFVLDKNAEVLSSKSCTQHEWMTIERSN